jgi:enterochelin esterase-like enzyme
MPRKPRAKHHVYVVELDDRVWNHGRFRRAVYVGMTGLDPDIRFDKHKAGIQANTFVQEFGLRLLPALYERYNPMSYEDARSMEVELGIRLRANGYGVWQA